MTGRNRALNAARNGLKRQRQLLRKERLADGNPFSLLTAHANGRPLYVKCGRAIGANVLAVVTGGATLGELQQHAPDWLVADLRELTAHELCRRGPSLPVVKTKR